MPLTIPIVIDRKRLSRARARRLRPIRPSRKNELWYKATLLSLVKRCHGLVNAALAELKSSWQQQAGDSAAMIAADMTGMPPDITKGMAGKLGGLDRWAKRMAGLAVEKNKDEVDARLAAEIKRAIGVDVSAVLKSNAPLLKSMKTATTDNIALIKSIPEQYFDRVTETVTSGWTQGIRWESLVEQIQRDGDITENRAKLIARDQTSKMNSSFNQERQQQVGIEKYEWSTSQDERVRDSHAEMDGEICSWDDPPMVDGERVHAGMAVNCRCAALPYIEPDTEIAGETGEGEGE